MHFDEPSPEEYNFQLPHALECKARYASHPEYWRYPHLPIPSFIRIHEDRYTIDGWSFHYRDFTRNMLRWLRLTLDEWFLMNTSTWFRDWIMEIMGAIFESVQHWQAQHT